MVNAGAPTHRANMIRGNREPDERLHEVEELFA